MTDTILDNTKYAKKENYLKIEIYKMHWFLLGFFFLFLQDTLNAAFTIDEVSRWEKKKVLFASQWMEAVQLNVLKISVMSYFWID